MKYQTMRIDHLKHLNIKALIGNVELTVSGETLTIEPVAPKKKPRTKVEYVKCEFVTKWEHVKLMEDTGESLFFLPNDEFIEVMTQESAIRKLRNGHELYRRIETPITEREAFIEVGIEILKDVNPYALGKLFDSGKFKLVN